MFNKEDQLLDDLLDNEYMVEVGIITDGDIRRNMELNQSDFFNIKAEDIMTRNPTTISKNEKITVAEEIMKQKEINSILVEENNLLIGIIQIYTLDKK